MNKRFLLILAGGLLFASSALASSNSLGTLQENVSVGKVISIGLNPSPTGNWYLVANSNSAVATATVSPSPGSALLISGISSGSDVISACTDVQGTNCMQVTVIVSPVGQVLGVATVNAHPAKSWVIQGQTVYYIDANGLIPITTWKIFLSNGGKQSLIQPINSADMALPFESFMTVKDSRVQN